MLNPTFDLIVIGSGPAGQKSAVQAAKLGKKVAIVEQHSTLGGGCVHAGTLPSKSFRESVYRFALGSGGKMAQETDGKKKKFEFPDMGRLLKRKDRVVECECQVIADQMKRNNIKVFEGKARFVSKNEVEVVGKKSSTVLSGKFIFVAVGARPVAPKHLEVDGKLIVDSDTVLDLKKVPKTMVVLGAGIIGCEYASMFAMAGTKVFLVDRRNEILASVDREIVKHLEERFTHEGMEIILGCEAQKVDKKKSGLQVHLSSKRMIEAEAVLVALGRSGNTEGMELKNAGVECDERGLIKVDKHFRTKTENVYAIGDVVGAPALASTSMEQGRIASCHAFNIISGHPTGMPDLFPYGIYTIPEISMLGLTEEALKAQGANFVVGRAKYRELARGQIVGDRWGLLKILVDEKTFKLLGVHIIGDNAADLIHIGQAVMELGGDANFFIRSVFNYPTLAEAYKTAALHAMNQIRGTIGRTA